MKTETRKCTGKFLSDNFNDFPFAQKGEILFFDKGRTGCGGTTLAGQSALTNNIKVVILMPSVASVKSKEMQSDFINKRNVQFLYESNYMIIGRPNVIFATYDKISLIIDELDDDSCQYNLLIDEYHTLTRDIDFRPVIRQVVEKWDKWLSVTLMTASPDNYLEDAVKQLYPDWKISKLSIKWLNYQKYIRVVTTHYVQRSLCKLILKYLYSDDACNLYLFYNNVNGINRLIEKCQLSTTDYYTICSSSQTKAVGVADIKTVNSQPRKITFITAAGFEGMDIKDENACTVCVVDMSIRSTLYDWETMLQMAGRCRNTKYAMSLLYHHTNGYRNDILRPAQIQLELLRLLNSDVYQNNLDDNLGGHTECYLPIDNKLELHPIAKATVLRKKDIFDNVQNEKSLVAYLRDHGFNVMVDQDELCDEEYAGKRINFKTLCEMVSAGKDVTGYQNSTLAIKAVKLGFDKLEKLKYKIPSVKRAINTLDIENFEETVVNMMHLNTGTWYRNEAISKRIEEVNALFDMDFNTTHIYQTLDEMGISYYQKIKRNERGVVIIDSGQNLSHFRHLPYKTDVRKVKGFDLVCSVCTSPGQKATWMNWANFSAVRMDRPDSKQDQYLFSECYNSTKNGYRRKESSFDACDCIVLDVDNGMSIDDFNDFVSRHYANAYHYIYHSYSSTIEHPKYRVVFPLDKTLKFRPGAGNSVSSEYIKAYKAIKLRMFDVFQDCNCQLWYYVPVSNIMAYGCPTTFLNSDYFEKRIEELVIANRAEANQAITNDPTKSILTADKEIQQSKTKRTGYSDLVYPADKILSIINQCEQGTRDKTIFQIVSRMKREDIDYIRRNINDPEKLSIFNQKVKYKSKLQ